MIDRLACQLGAQVASKATTSRPKLFSGSSRLAATVAYLLVVVFVSLQLITINCQLVPATGQTARRSLPDLVSATSDEPIQVNAGQVAYISCVAKNLQNYTVIWRFSNDAHAPASPTGAADDSSLASSLSSDGPADSGQPINGDGELGVIISAGRQRVISDNRFSVIRSHDTWLLRIQNVRLSDTGTYICQTNSEPKVRMLRILSVSRPETSNTSSNSKLASDIIEAKEARGQHFAQLDYNFTDCCRQEYVFPRCQRLCSIQALASRYQSISIAHECYSSLPSITRCMVAGRNVTDCCSKRHIPSRCNTMCGHSGETSSMSIQDQTYCADYAATIMSCVAEGIDTLPGQPELVTVEAVSPTTLKVSWQKVTDEKELAKLDGWVINLTKLSSFEDKISPAGSLAKEETGSPAAPAATAASQAQGDKVQPADGGSRTKNLLASSPVGPDRLVDVANSSGLLAMTKYLSSSDAASAPSISLRLHKLNDEFNIDNLKPFTVYQIEMFGYNSLGRSQQTDPIRALTLAPADSAGLAGATGGANESASETGGFQADDQVEPNLPDTRKCCENRGVTLKKCVDTLCDPIEADKATIEDLMICAPWSNVTFSCLASSVDHSNCCRSRGVSNFCLSMCSGEVKRVDYRHFRCLAHMSTYTNCILESHDVLPSEPQMFQVGPITDTWAVLNWRPPKRRAKFLQGYRIFWRRVDSPNDGLAPGVQTKTHSESTVLNADDEFFNLSAEAATNPYLLDALKPETVYETFIVAVNKYGESKPSARYMFRTHQDPAKRLAWSASSADGAGIESRLPLATAGSQSQQAQSYYNETVCCASSGVQRSCLQVCDYDLKVGDAYNLITTCNTQMPAIMRCLAGSRNSVPCCRNRGVSERCLNVCAGLTEHSPLMVANQCAQDFGKILSCMDEGSKQIPGAPQDLHTVDIKSDRVMLKWAPASEDKLRTDVEYHLRYQQLQQAPDSPTTTDSASEKQDLSSLIAVVPLHPLEHNLILTSNQTEATIDKLKPNTRYSIYATAENRYGISLPSLVLIIQTPDESQQGDNEMFKRRATLGAPHSLEVLRSETDSLVLKWAAPLFVNSDAQIKYRVFYKLIGPNGPPQPSETASQQTGNTTADTATIPESGGAPVQQVASNWTVLETSETSALLRGLQYSSQYAITVQAYSKQLRGHMGEIVLAATAKPVPPSLNPPLVINHPIEGNNITIMCVALGQPTPQISMFINGLLVQKRTQPYVVYHLVNLVRGHLTITCFASNGQGKDYASVNSRTEISVKFPSKATAKTRSMKAISQSVVRLSCQVSGNPQPSVVWTFNQAGSQAIGQSNSQPSDNSSLVGKIVTPSERIETLIVSQFDSPFTWSHTLTIRNVSLADAGQYRCRALNSLTESNDAIELEVSELPATSGKLILPEQSSDLMECCRSQNVSSKCMPVCASDGLDIDRAFKIRECQPHLDKLMYCAADGSDHRSCCRARQVPYSCLRWCAGAKLNIPAICFLSSALDINQCFQEGRALLPGPPRNVHMVLASESVHSAESLGASEPEVATTTLTSMMNAQMFVSTASMSSPSMSPVLAAATATTTTSNETPPASSTTTNPSQPSVIGSMVMMLGDQQQQQASNSSSQTVGSATSGQARSEPLILEWESPIKNSQLVQYYRVFWRPFGTRELSRAVTNKTWLRLSELNLGKAYEFVVKASNNHGSSVYSDPLTVKPADIVANQGAGNNSLGLIWFIPSSHYGSGSLFARVMASVLFATLFMFSSLATVMILERRGYLKRFASSKSNGSRISFANPAYMKHSVDGDPSQDSNFENVVWDNGHSLEMLSSSSSSSAASTLPPPPTSN